MSETVQEIYTDLGDRLRDVCRELNPSQPEGTQFVLVPDTISPNEKNAAVLREKETPGKSEKERWWHCAISCTEAAVFVYGRGCLKIHPKEDGQLDIKYLDTSEKPERTASRDELWDIVRDFLGPMIPAGRTP